jgi:uncharacterized membrane protein
MKKLVNYFLRGLVFVAPIGITLYVLWIVFRTIDGWLGIPIPGVGFALTIVVITLVGFMASTLVARGLLSLLERVMTRLPFVRLLYTSTKDLLDAFVGEKRRFDKPVLVTLFPGQSAMALGFVTQESLGRLGLTDHVTVYFPQSYNFAGNLLVYPASQVTRLEADSSEVMAFIVSGGVTDVPASEDRRSTTSERDRLTTGRLPSR